MYICNIYIYVLYNIYISVFIIWCAYSMYLYIGVYDMCVCIVYIYIYMCVCVCAHVYVGAGGVCGASDYWGMARGPPYLSVALLLALGIGGRVCGGGTRWVRWHGGLFMNIWWRARFTLRRVY